MAAPHWEPRYTPEEYLALERQASGKSEYIAGQIVAMSGVSWEHSLITGNLFRVLSNTLLDQPCTVHASDLRIQVRSAAIFTYPDIIVVCGEPEFADAQVDTVLNPTILMEVLSPSTEGYDRGAKFTYYRRLPALHEYVLVSQDKPLVEHYARQGTQWVLTATDDLAGSLELPTLGVRVPLAEIYRKVTFPAHPPAGE